MNAMHQSIEHHDIEQYLGDMDPADFTDAIDVQDYFSESSLLQMFGDDDLDLEHAAAVADHIIAHYLDN